MANGLLDEQQILLSTMAAHVIAQNADELIVLIPEYAFNTIAVSAAQLLMVLGRD